MAITYLLKFSFFFTIVISSVDKIAIYATSLLPKAHPELINIY